MPAPAGPPSNPLPNQYVKLATVAEVNGQAGLMTSWLVIQSVTGVGATTQEFADWCVSQYSIVFPAMHAIQAVLAGAVAELYDPVSNFVLQSATSLNGVVIGANAGGLIPTQVAPLVAKQTGFAGRRFRGRVYVPFVAESQLDSNGELLAGQKAILAGGVNAIFGTQTVVGAGGTSLCSPILVHKAAHLAPLSSVFILAFVATGKLGTQRRRGDYGQKNQPL